MWLSHKIKMACYSKNGHFVRCKELMDGMGQGCDARQPWNKVSMPLDKRRWLHEPWAGKLVGIKACTARRLYEKWDVGGRTWDAGRGT